MPARSTFSPVPLRVVALRGTVPGEWVADFRAVAGKRAGVALEARPQLASIFDDLATPEAAGAKSAATADAAGISSCAATRTSGPSSISVITRM